MNRRTLRTVAFTLTLVAGQTLALAGGGGGGGGTDSKPSTPAPAPKKVLPQVKPVTLKVPEPAHDDAHAPEAHAPAAGHAPATAHGAPRVPASSKGGAKVPPKSGAPKQPAPAPAHDAEPTDIMTPDDALSALQAGNARWLANAPEHPQTGMLRRRTTAEEGQHPFVTVLTCSDSRVPVERVFDRGVGEVFAVRVAGNVADGPLTGTVEYGLEHLHTPLLVVMGHSRCGAVKATIENAHVGPNLQGLVARIKPAVDRARKGAPNAEDADLLSAAVRENVWQTVFDLYRTSPTVVSLVSSGKVKVVGAVLDVSTGQVEWLGEHPWNDALVSAFARPAPAAEVTSAEPAEQATPASENGH